MEINIEYKHKYLKYKQKYLDLKIQQSGGAKLPDTDELSNHIKNFENILNQNTDIIITNDVEIIHDKDVHKQQISLTDLKVYIKTITDGNNHRLILVTNETPKGNDWKQDHNKDEIKRILESHELVAKITGTINTNNMTAYLLVPKKK